MQFDSQNIVCTINMLKTIYFLLFILFFFILLDSFNSYIPSEFDLILGVQTRFFCAFATVDREANWIATVLWIIALFNFLLLLLFLFIDLPMDL